jgi:tRNA pseudouridine32 synthase / 23S rRNA pseudouridine746 synthase
MARDSGECFTRFVADVAEVEPPAKFNYPFAYTPHPLAIVAARELQAHIESQTEWAYDFGRERADTYGKMFGVLVVESAEMGFGYLSAFSGNLAGATILNRFVPPVYNRLQDDGFFRTCEALVEAATEQIRVLSHDPEFTKLRDLETRLIADGDREIAALALAATGAKADRRIVRERAAATLPEAELSVVGERLNSESADWAFRLKDLKRQWRRKREANRLALAGYQLALDELVARRAELSADIQRRLFEQYYFLNGQGVAKHLLDIFPSESGVAPSGAGECAAPKLLQYAFANGLRPVCLAEFWWGSFYPACKSKCEPILRHMLVGVETDPNPVTARLRAHASETLNVIFEDEWLAVVDKPIDLLSTPGKEVRDSVYTRALARFTEATGPVLVHRLDGATSGVMVLAKSPDVYTQIQKQFLDRTIAKQYVAVLEEVPDVVLAGQTEGLIDLPLRVDLDDRPRQMVCHSFGKAALTRWQLTSIDDGRARMRFFPVTGRTHQLRVHAAHRDGLSVPIRGDDLYGCPADRLHLHAEQLQLVHPISDTLMTFRSEPNF